MQNGISKIVKSARFNQLLLKSGRLQPHYITQGVEYTSIYSHTTWHRRIAVIVQKASSTSQSDFGGKQDSLIGLRVFRGRGTDSNLNVPRRGVTLPPTKSDKVGGRGGGFYDFRGTS